MRESKETGLQEESANSLTHGLGLVLAIVAAAMVFDAITVQTTLELKISCGVYAITLVVLYAVSTLSHLSKSPMRKAWYRSVDQGVIFLFIAATVTPFAVAFLHGQRLWILMVVMWLAALTGFSSKVFWRHRVNSTVFAHYLLLGWLPATSIQPVFAELSAEGIWLVVAGGVCYTVGTVFLIFDRKIRFFHSVRHLLVIIGSGCHFL